MERATETAAAVCAEASAFFEAFEALADAFDLFVDSPEAVVGLISLHTEDRSAGGALKVGIRAECSDAGLNLLAALRAGNVQLDVIQKALRHVQSPVGCDSTTVEAPAGVVPSPARDPGGVSA